MKEDKKNKTKNIELKDMISNKKKSKKDKDKEKDKEKNKEDEKQNEKQNDELKDNNNDKLKQFQIHIYIPLILSAFIYMILNSVNFLIQIDPDYLLKLNINEENANLNSNKIRINKYSKNFIMLILLVNMLSKSFGLFITNIKILKNRIDIILLFFISISILCNIFLYLKKTTNNIIFTIHTFFAFISGLFFVPLLKLNWTFLPFNEGLISGAFNSFEYLSIIFLSLIKRFLELKYLLLINSIFNFIIFISIIYLRYKYKGFFIGKSSYLHFNLEEKNENTDNEIVENIIKSDEAGETKEKIKKNLTNSETKDKESESKEELIEQFETDKENEESSKENDENKNIFINNLISDLSSNRFILLLITYLLLFFSNYIISLIYLPFSIIFNLKMLLNSSVHLTIYILIYCISSLFFGIYFDLKNVRYLISRLILLSCLTILLFFPTKYFSYFLDLISVINAICLSGIKTIIYPLVYREFFNNEGNYYLISIFLFVEIFVYILTPIILKYFVFELTDFILLFITCMAMLLGGFFIMGKKLFPIIYDTNDNYDINTKRGEGLKLLSLQDELPPLSKD